MPVFQGSVNDYHLLGKYWEPPDTFAGVLSYARGHPRGADHAAQLYTHFNQQFSPLSREPFLLVCLDSLDLSSPDNSANETKRTPVFRNCQGGDETNRRNTKCS